MYVLRYLRKKKKQCHVKEIKDIEIPIFCKFYSCM